MPLVKFVEKHFAILCVLAVVVGLGWPALGLRPTADIIAVLERLLLPFLAGILFFTGLKLDFAAAGRELRRPALLVYLWLMLMIVLPLGMWALARAILPDFALGVLILAAMPAGMACATMSDIVRGNISLAMVLILITSLLCPITVPLLTLVVGAGDNGDAGSFLLQRAGFLAATLLSPVAAAWLVRRAAPKFVARHREKYTGLSITSLVLLIVSIMSTVSGDTINLLLDRPLRVSGLGLFIVGFTVIFYLVGFWLTPWRAMTDRAAVAICAAYVNNGLAMVFAKQFWGDRVEVILPAILLEAPMVLAIPVVRAILARRERSTGPDVTARRPPPA